MMSKKEIETKFGLASSKNDKGYYKIISSNEGNKGKLLHRLIYEDYYSVCLLPYVDIHHIDGNKINNDISNLKPLYHGQHSSLHKFSEETKEKLRQAHLGEKNHFYGKKHSKESREKMRQAHLNVSLSKKHRLSLSKKLNSTGIYSVYKNRGKHTQQGFVWCYSYYTDTTRKVLSNVDLLKLKEKVIKNGLEWIVIDSKKAELSFKENAENRIKYPPKINMSEDTKKKLSKINTGKHHTEDTKLKMSKNLNSSGISYVSIENDKRYAQGFRWKYTYVGEDGKRHAITSTNLKKLKKQVLDRGFSWIIINKEIAEMNFNKY